jgi:hypothetical protein
MTMTQEELSVLRQLHVTIANNETSLARLNAHLQSLIPTFIEETANGTALESETSTLKWNAERDTYFRCTGLLVSVPDGVTEARLQLGEVIIPLQNTTTLLTPIQRILKSNDARVLSYTTGADNGGELFVWLWGDAVPKYGKM